MMRHAVHAALLMMTAAFAPAVHGQMIYTETPFQSFGSSYSEGASIGWSLRGPNWFADFGGGGPLLPPFGPADPGGGLSGGFGFGGGGVSGQLGFRFGQSSSRSSVSTTPSLTTTDGYPGSISSGVVRPFVIGFTPVVGQLDQATAPLQQASAAQRQIGQTQRSKLLKSQIELEDRKLAKYLQRAERAEADGNKRMARANYRLAIGIAAEPLRSKLKRRMADMLAKPAE